MRVDLEHHLADRVKPSVGEELVLGAFDVHDQEVRPDPGDFVVERPDRHGDGPVCQARAMNRGIREIAGEVKRRLAVGPAEQADLELRRDTIEPAVFFEHRLEIGVRFVREDAVGADPLRAGDRDHADSRAELHDDIVRLERAQYEPSFGSRVDPRDDPAHHPVGEAGIDVHVDAIDRDLRSGELRWIAYRPLTLGTQPLPEAPSRDGADASSPVCQEIPPKG